MKQTIYTLSMAFLLIASLSSCDPKKALEEKLEEVVANEIMENAGIDGENITNVQPKGTFKVNYDGSELLNTEDAIASTQFTSELMAFAVRNNNANISLMAGLSLDPTKLKNTPLSVEMVQGSNREKKDNFTFMATIGGQMYVMKEGTVTVENFSKEKLVMKIEGKGGLNSGDTHNGKGLKDMSVEVSCENPSYVFIGVKKEEVLP